MPHTKTQIVATLALLTPIALYAYRAHEEQAAKPPAKPAPTQTPTMAKKPTTAQKILNAMSAAPAEISKNATIMDWADMPSGQPKQLRAGTNGWVCYPSTPVEAAGGEDPMCIDKPWQNWAEAWMSKTPPKITGPGIAYMLKGDKGASNTDPFATAPTPTNQWVVSPSHVMVLFEDPKVLDAYPTDPKNGGPWVMWKGTAYAHLMVPVSATKIATMPVK
jgi:hypothetical protein